MIEGLFNQVNYVALKKMMDVTALRHDAIASNMANIETPSYKRIDVSSDFRQELSRAVSSQSTTQISQIKPGLIVDTTAIAHGQDGNTVQLENEMLELSQNTLNHTLESQLITASLLKLRLAITGRS